MSNISRRQLLAGAAAAGLLLPFLRGGRRARAAGSPQKTKAIFVYVPDGCIPAKWHPIGSETSFTLGPMTEPLAPVKDHLLFLKGLDMYAGGATHEGGVRKVLTATAPQSLDVYLGEKLNAVDQLPHASIQLGAASNFQNGSGSMSFIGAGVEVKPDDDPVNAFTRIFGAAPGAGGTGTEDTPEKKRRRSILDLASADITRARAKLGAVEKEKLDIHTASFDEVQRRVSGQPIAGCTSQSFDLRGYANITTDYYPKTYEKEDKFQQVGELQMDIAALALSCKMTRIVSLMWSHPVSPTHIPTSGAGLGNHDASHYGDPNSGTATDFVSLKRWFMERFVYLIQKLAATPDPDGGMLIDNAVVFLCSELGDSNLHDHHNMPFLLAGGAAGQLRGGRLLDYTGQVNGDNQPHAKLLVSIANMMGVPITEYGYTGHGTGPLPGLIG
ncbi:MAG: DUF1552 domain-containing protein [Deltaproteobacteria bacterium]|nr:DUF1552 domain-containing protein [Deltaproteobacteria bacterium]